MSKGIDYGGGITNIDKKTGIRFGVIHQNEVLQAWADSSEAEYGPPTCPKCGNEADKLDAFGDSFKDGIPDDYTTEKYECDEFVCVDCKHVFGSESAYGDEPLGFYLKDNEYEAQQDSCGDIFITKSPYYTRAEFCSPCAPGACYIINSREDGDKAYCFGHDFFDFGKAPYPVYAVKDDSVVLPEKK